MFSLAAGLIVIACAAQPTAPYIRLNGDWPVSPQPTRSIVSLRVAVAIVISLKGDVESYSPLLDCLSARLGRPVEMMQRRTFAEVNDLLRDGKADMAFVSSSAYIAGHRDFGMQLLVAPQISGKLADYAYLIVPASSPARGMADLQGKVFAFDDPLSYVGRDYPTLLVRRLGYEPEIFFARTFFTYGQDDSIHAVAGGLADGAVVSRLAYDLTAQHDPALTARVRIIHQSEPLAAAPVVVGPQVRPQLRAELYDLLVTLDQNDAGRAALQALGLARFVPIDNSAYDSTRQIEQGIRP
jgi:phosphonate transport system substrate-binding protein